MKNIKLSLFLVSLSIFTGCNQKTSIEESSRFHGLWSLHIMEQINPETGEWSEWRNGMQGYILYDNRNHMSVHLTTKGYEDTELRFPNFVDTISIDALKHLTGSYVYFALYKVNEVESVVEHARLSHSNPDMWNEIVKRRYVFSGDTLILQPVEEETAGLRLKWVREP